MKQVLITLLILALPATYTAFPSQNKFPPGKSEKTVWIDTDIAIGVKRPSGNGYADVDDAYALLQVINAPRLHLAGVSTVFGNTALPKATKIARKIKRRFANEDVAVYQGSDSAIDVKNLKSNEAVEGLANALQKQKITILAIGPATNIAKLILLHPEVLPNIKEIILVAGRRRADYQFNIGENALPFPDLNFELDPTAFQILLQTEIPITLCPFELSRQIWITEKDLGTIAHSGKTGHFLAKKSLPWLQNWYEFGSHGFNPFDALASHYLVHPRQIQYETLNAHIAYHPDDTKEQTEQTIPVYKPYLICNRGNGRPIRYCYQPAEEVKNQLLKDLNSKN